jgi:predicted HicB family RNase H-like nuclease
MDEPATSNGLANRVVTVAAAAAADQSLNEYVKSTFERHAAEHGTLEAA